MRFNFHMRTPKLEKLGLNPDIPQYESCVTSVLITTFGPPRTTFRGIQHSSKIGVDFTITLATRILRFLDSTVRIPDNIATLAYFTEESLYAGFEKVIMSEVVSLGLPR